MYLIVLEKSVPNRRKIYITVREFYASFYQIFLIIYKDKEAYLITVGGILFGLKSFLLILFCYMAEYSIHFSNGILESV